ncbi:hypothetical protein QN277_019017 [Acacia crassicarpa]|uniref:BTB domain-containing protein n=1 Tax=Acacia crassicarpa TaxID=499986 RepID=A0AAE1JVR4_9FABA|nr:hypothetical protein QN277_019017 [Acacia crassicarpa]
MDQPPSSAGRRSLKRNRKQEFAEEGAVHPTTDCKVLALEPQQSHQDLLSEVVAQVTILNSSLSSSQSDRLTAKRAAHLLSELAENELIVDSIVDCGAVPALLQHLKAPEPGVTKPYEHEVEQGCLLILALLAKKPQHQQLIVDAGALAYLMDLLKRHKTCGNSPALTGLLTSAANAINNLAAGNSSIKTRVGMEGGIPPLVELFEFDDAKPQSAAAGALLSLALKNNENKNQILKLNVLPTLVLMLGSEHATTHCEAVSVISMLASYSPKMTTKVLLAGSLQPVIILLRSCCFKCQKEAARLVGIFARTDSDCKVHIAQRGAIPPLIDMLKSPHAELREMSGFAIATLVEDPHNQVGIAYNGGIEPLLNLLSSKKKTVQHNATFCVYRLAENEDNVVDIIKLGGVQKLLDGDFTAKSAKKFVGNTMEVLQEKMHGRVLKQLLHLIRFGEKAVQSYVVLALAHLCSSDDQKIIFVDNNGLAFLVDLLTSRNLNKKREASMALYSLAIRSTSISPLDTTPSSMTPQVYLCERYVNNPALSDVTFLVEGKRFYAHRISLLASFDAFRAMLDGVYREKEAKDIPIPNIKWVVFELMMRFIYTGTVDVNLDLAQDLLRAADQYLVDGLKRSCECVIAQDISLGNVSQLYELSDSMNAMSLRRACILFLLEQFEKLSVKPWYNCLLRRVAPDIIEFFRSLLGSGIDKK